MKVAIETHIYYHTQTPGFQVRRTATRNGRRVADVSRYFAIGKYGRLEARRKAQNYKRYKLLPYFRAMGYA